MPWVIGFLVVAVLGMTGSAVMFASWTDVDEVDDLEARERFERTLEESATGPAYILVSADGSVSVDRSLEGEPQDLEALHALAWSPQEGRIVHSELPFWFVRAKSTEHVNLGTLMAVVMRDWEHLDLSVTEDDLARRGPGLVLDVTREDGARLMLWLK